MLLDPRKPGNRPTSPNSSVKVSRPRWRGADASVKAFVLYENPEPPSAFTLLLEAVQNQQSPEEFGARLLADYTAKEVLMLGAIGLSAAARRTADARSEIEVIDINEALYCKQYVLHLLAVGMADPELSDLQDASIRFRQPLSLRVPSVRELVKHYLGFTRN
jgi:hypothetical protein